MFSVRVRVPFSRRVCPAPPFRVYLDCSLPLIVLLSFAGVCMTGRCSLRTESGGRGKDPGCARSLEHSSRVWELGIEARGMTFVYQQGRYQVL